MKRTLALIVLAFLVAAIPEKSFSQEEATVPEVTPAEVYRKMAEGTPPLLINTMSLIECRDHRIPGSQCVPVPDVAERWKGPEDKSRETIFYCESPWCLRSHRAAETALKRGFQKVSVMTGGLPAWKEAGYDVFSEKRIPRVGIVSIKPAFLSQWLSGGNGPLLLDIRTPGEFEADHMADSVNVPFEILHQVWRDLPMDRSIVVIDDRGHRSFLAACYLFERGFVDIRRLFGGMSNWKAYQSKGNQNHGIEKTAEN